MKQWTRQLLALISRSLHSCERRQAIKHIYYTLAMQWDKIQHRKKGVESIILYRITEKSSGRRGWFCKSLRKWKWAEGEDDWRSVPGPRERKHQGERRPGVLTGQEALELQQGAWGWAETTDRQVRPCLGLRTSETTLGELEREHLKWEAGPDFLAGGALWQP